MKSISVSVVIPVYNAQSTLARALQSVYAQSRPPDEVICVDDGSTDGSTQVAHACAPPSGPAIHWLRAERNRGAAAARNRGMDQASGSHVAFLDADDAWHPEKLRLQLDAMSAQHLDMLGGHSAYGQAGPWPAASVIGTLRPQMAPLWRAMFSNPFHTSSVIMRRDPAHRFPETMQYGEDYALWLALMASGWRCARHDAPLSAMFKRAYGQTGLSADLWRMQRGELAALAGIGLRAHPMIALAAIPWSCLKFARRVVVSTREGWR